MQIQKHLGFYHHHRKAHFDEANIVQSVNFRLGDAIPRYVLEEARAAYSSTGVPRRRAHIHTKLERFADRGLGAAILGNRDVARILENELKHSNGKQYELLAWCIMPNHVHVCFQQYSGHRLATILQGWKGRSSRLINSATGAVGPLWEPDYWDRSVRTAESLRRAVDYIHNNPVSARLCRRIEDWPFSSACDIRSRAAAAALLG